MAVRRKMRSPRSAGRGRRRKTCQTMMLIDRILRAGETANESVGRSLNPQATSLESSICSGRIVSRPQGLRKDFVGLRRFAVMEGMGTFGERAECSPNRRGTLRLAGGSLRTGVFEGLCSEEGLAGAAYGAPTGGDLSTNSGQAARRSIDQRYTRALLLEGCPSPVGGPRMRARFLRCLRAEDGTRCQAFP
jgi:hypothetical protein